MILFFLLQIYWKFNFDELDEKIKNSFSMPIFVNCYTPSCVKCKNIKSQYDDFISISGNRTDMYTSMINCLANEYFCQYLGVTITPVSFLIIGNNSRYWPKTNSNKAEDWITFVDKFFNSNLKKVDLENKNQLDNIIQKSTNNGGVTYYIVVKNNGDELLRKIRRSAYHYLIYNVSFAYSIDESIEKESITRFYTKDYSEKFSGDLDDVDNFINEVQFGPLHMYDYEEWLKVKSPKMFLFTNQNYILNSQKKGLIKLANKFHQISIGWSSIKEESSKLFFDHFPLNDLPINLIYNDNNGNDSCFALSKERTLALSEIDFVPNFLNKYIKCNESSENSNTSNIIAFKYGKISGKKFLIFYTMVGLVTIGMLRLKIIEEEKEE